MVAGDCCVVVTATFRLLYVLVVMEHASRNILHVRVTAHPTAGGTLQPWRAAVAVDHGHRVLIHDRDRHCSPQRDQPVRHLGLRILQTPARSPHAHALWERLLGALRRECVDCMMPLTGYQRRCLRKAWVPHDHHGRPHLSWGPGIPQPPPPLPAPLQVHRHKLPGHLHVAGRPILGGLHHEYQLEERAAWQQFCGPQVAAGTWGARNPASVSAAAILPAQQTSLGFASRNGITAPRFGPRSSPFRRRARRPGCGPGSAGIGARSIRRADNPSPTSVDPRR
jgi:hypothetical protein